MKHLPDITLALLAVLLLTGCGTDNTDGDQRTDTGEQSVMDVASADTASPDADDVSTPDAGSEPDTQNTDASDSGEGTSKFFVNFEYRKVEEGGLSTRTGVEVTLVGNTRIIKHASNSRDEDLSDEDAQTLQEDYLTDDVYDKMANDTWECGSDEKYNGARHEFEARLGTQTDSPEPIRTISGCIAEDSSQPDTELVQRIVGKLQDLRDSYFN
jgi:hypothetical protein